MKKVDINTEIEVTESNKDIDVEIDYRCFFAPDRAFAPMTKWTTIHEFTTLQREIQVGKEDYEKQYDRVEVMEVRVDL